VADPTHPQVYLLSDGTGITAETLARTLLTQFDGVVPGWHLQPFVRSPEQMEALFDKIRTGPQPALVVATFAAAELRVKLRNCPVPVLDIFSDHLEQLEGVFEREARIGFRPRPRHRATSPGTTGASRP
jgi:[pyruvate, water dikinase]-phosphate phosphotransferase / [pyruvate, water dikinase] kinase